MGRSGKGYRVRWLRGACVAEVWTGARYVSASFRPEGGGKRAREKAERAAEDFGITEAAKVRAGVRARSMHPSATASLVSDYVAELRSLNRSEVHLKQVGRILGVLAVEVPDLAADGVDQRVGRLLAKPPAVDPAEVLGPATRNRWLRTVRGFCRWAVDHRRISDDPTALLKVAQVDDHLPDVFTLDEIRRCLAHTHWDTPRVGSDPRDPYHPLFATLIYTGFRFQEAARLHWEDIDWSGGAVMVRLRAGAIVKRRKERLVPLQAGLRGVFEPLKKSAGPCFPGRGHNSHRGFRSFLDRAGVPLDGRSPHACRHTWASLMAATGVTTDLLRAYMGHSSITTTAIYTVMATRYVTGVEGWKRGELRLDPPPQPPRTT